MAHFNSGDVYCDPVTDKEYEVVDDVDTMGMPTHEAEYVQVRMRDDDGELYSFDVEQVRDWDKVPATADTLTDDERAEIADRAREDWNRLAREFGTSVDAVRTVVTGQ